MLCDIIFKTQADPVLKCRREITFRVRLCDGHYQVFKRIEKNTLVMTNEVEDTTFLSDLNPHFLDRGGCSDAAHRHADNKESCRQSKSVPAPSLHASIPSNFVRSSGYHLSVKMGSHAGPLDYR